MEGLKQIQEAIEATRQGETPEAKDIDIGEGMRSYIADLENLKSANNKDFKTAAIDILKALIEWCAELQQQYDKDRDDLTTTLQDRFKAMDKAITDLWNYTDTVDDLRWAMLFHTVRLDYAFDKLVESGFIKPWTEEMKKQMWSDDYIRLLGFDCSGEELRQRLIDQHEKYKIGIKTDKRGL